ncbi:Phage integrase family protein [Desulfacinum hydrothermale DSM 13146]|uniref:Phage integrase family protein n=1 Tax=Desulfacinum hydrothermale DSM 13146 TaxID=1121390 RepID=A0A1W1XMH3_9BACT|nr:Phage integrase family protein [Desulfacinum hydrothermale DSM 13146]
MKSLESNLHSLLRRYLAKRHRQGTTDQAIFLSKRRMRLWARRVLNRIKFWLAKGGHKDIGPRGRRHTFATHLYTTTSDLLVIKRPSAIGTSPLTEIYTHLVVLCFRRIPRRGSRAASLQ